MGDKWPWDTNLVRNNGSFEKAGFREIEFWSFRSIKKVVSFNAMVSSLQKTTNSFTKF